MNDISKGVVSLSDDLTIASGYTFDQFQSTRYYKGQNPERAFWLEEKFMLQGHTFMAGLFLWRKKRRGKSFMTKSCSLGGLGGLIRNGAMLNRCMMPDRISAIFM